MCKETLLTCHSNVNRKSKLVKQLCILMYWFYLMLYLNEKLVSEDPKKGIHLEL